MFNPTSCRLALCPHHRWAPHLTLGLLRYRRTLIDVIELVLVAVVATGLWHSRCGSGGAGGKYLAALSIRSPSHQWDRSVPFTPCAVHSLVELLTGLLGCHFLFVLHVVGSLWFVMRGSSPHHCVALVVIMDFIMLAWHLRVIRSSWCHGGR